MEARWNGLARFFVYSTFSWVTPWPWWIDLGCILGMWVVIWNGHE
jgi:hypothetical protein